VESTEDKFEARHAVHVLGHVQAHGHHVVLHRDDLRSAFYR
jgi:hypothetical protein